jgi:predicted nucleic acid-binding protein
MAAVVIDTDVVSYLHKKDSRARLFRPHVVGNERIISFMTLAELELWALERGWGPAARARLERHLQGYAVCFADAPLCRLWAEVRRRADRRGRPVSAADAWHAATAVALGTALVTHNPRDYAGVDGLTVLSAVIP